MAIDALHQKGQGISPRNAFSGAGGLLMPDPRILPDHAAVDVDHGQTAVPRRIGELMG